MAQPKVRRVVVPIVLAVTVVAVAAGSGCRNDKPKPDAGVHDATIDTPVI